VTIIILKQQTISLQDHKVSMLHDMYVLLDERHVHRCYSNKIVVLAMKKINKSMFLPSSNTNIIDITIAKRCLTNGASGQWREYTFVVATSVARTRVGIVYQKKKTNCHLQHQTTAKKSNNIPQSLSISHSQVYTPAQLPIISHASLVVHIYGSILSDNNNNK
jgi:hypothetical protein